MTTSDARLIAAEFEARAASMDPRNGESERLMTCVVTIQALCDELETRPTPPPAPPPVVDEPAPAAPVEPETPRVVPMRERSA